MNMLNIYISECSRLDISKIEDCRSLGEVSEDGGTYSILSVEGGGGLFADSAELPILYRAGLRVLGLAWDKNELASSSVDIDDTGLTEEGKRLAHAATDMGIILDTSHLSDRSFYELHDEIPYPMLATHSNMRAVTDHKRNLTDDMAKMIGKRGGVIGINLYPEYLSGTDVAPRDDILRHFDHALTTVGEDAVGYGFDIDGTGGKYPKGFGESNSIHDEVTDLLLSHYSAGVVEKIAGANVLRFLSENLG